MYMLCCGDPFPCTASSSLRSASPQLSTYYLASVGTWQVHCQCVFVSILSLSGSCAHCLPFLQSFGPMTNSIITLNLPKGLFPFMVKGCLCFSLFFTYPSKSSKLFILELKVCHISCSQLYQDFKCVSKDCCSPPPPS